VEKKPSIAGICIELEGLHREAEDARAAADRVYETVYKAMCESAFKEFPVLKNMSAEQFRKFEERMSRKAFYCAVEVADLACEAEQEN
jgi:hypothetical protein